MKHYFASLLAVVLAASTASAVSTSTWVLAPELGEIPGFTTWALEIETDTDWLLGELEVNLSSGSLNQIESGGFGGGPEPIFQNLGDSGVFDPSPSFGEVGDNLGSSISDQPAFEESPTSLSVGWFNTRSTDIGVFSIATLTLSDDANGIISGRVITNAAGNDTSAEAINFLVVNGAITVIPEPSTIMLAGLGLIGFISRRRRS